MKTDADSILLAQYRAVPGGGHINMKATPPASPATHASFAASAGSANHASFAASAGSANHAGTAASAGFANHAGTAAPAGSANLCAGAYIFLYVSEGEVSLTADDEEREGDVGEGNKEGEERDRREILYESGDILLLKPQERVLAFSQKGCLLVLLGISASFLEEHLSIPALAECNSVLHPEQDYLRLKSLVQETAALASYAKTAGAADSVNPARLSESRYACELTGELYRILQALSDLSESAYDLSYASFHESALSPARGSSRDSLHGSVPDSSRDSLHGSVPDSSRDSSHGSVPGSSPGPVQNSPRGSSHDSPHRSSRDSSRENGGGSSMTRRVGAIARYIDQHYQEKLSLDDLAAAFYLTPQYLSAFFARNFQTNFKTYLNNKRLSYSLPDLRDPKRPIAEVAARNGFTSVSSYRRNFAEKYHMSPSAYRKASTGDSRTEKMGFAEDSQYFFDNDVSADTRKPDGQVSAEKTSFNSAILPHHVLPQVSPETRQNLRLEAAADARTIPATDQILNIGSAQNLLSLRFRQQLLDLNRKCHFPYIRLMELVTSATIPMILPSRQYYYKNADQILTFLYENRLIPIIELSREQFNYTFMPDGSHEDFYYVWRTNRWFLLLENFAQHISRRWPQLWISQWKFEVSMQPREKTAGFLSDFLRIRQILSASIPDVCLGGPGYHPATFDISASDFLSACRQKGVKLSFFSATLCNYTRIQDATGSRRAAISPDPEYLIDICRKLRRQVRHYDPFLPFYVTEFSSVSIRGLPTAYSCYQAAFLVKSLAGIRALTDLSGYWLFCDARRTNAQSRARRNFSTGQGLYTSSYMPTAAAYACCFYRQMGDSVIASGRNYLCTRTGQDHFRILLFHYTHFDATATAALPGEADFDQLYSLFPQEGPVRFRLRLEHLTKGNYHIRRYLIDGIQGSPFDLMIAEYARSQIDKPEFLQQIRAMREDERNAIVQNALPEYRSVYQSPADGQLTIEVSLPAHTMCYLDIQRLL